MPVKFVTYISHKKKMRVLSRRMKAILILLLLLLSATVSADEGFWVSNRIRVGYDRFFTSTQFKLSEELTHQFSFDAGALLKVNDMAYVEPRYVLKLPKLDEEIEHQIRLSFKFVFKH